MKKKILILFSGSRSIEKACEELGYETFSVDIEDYENTDLVEDILKLKISQIPWIPDVIWASPPCTTFSVASLGHHWTGGAGAYKPKTQECKKGLRILKKTLMLISEYQELNPNMKYYIENPTGMMRKMIEDIFNKYGLMRKREVVWYCRYGYNIAKSTDIWTNNNKFFGKKCKNHTYDKAGNQTSTHCHHEGARRGSQTGTQGKKNAHERGKIPHELCLEVMRAV